MTLTVEDLKHFQHQHPDYRLELVDGAIIVMSPSGYESDEIAAEIIAQLRNWVRPRKLGRVTASDDRSSPPSSRSGYVAEWRSLHRPRPSAWMGNGGV